MSQPVSVAVHLAVATPSVREPCFDHERLQVYQLALKLDAQVQAALPRRGHRELRDQLSRASLSVVANIAEGAGRVMAADKRRFYAIARGSATETAALLDVLRARGAITAEVYGQARHKLLRVVQMLSRLCLSR
jgi:four helix bundle protein